MKPMLDGPIPGQSLTAEPGSRPWEKPPKYTTVEETLQFYMDNLSSSPKKIASLLDKIEEGAPLTLIADTLQTVGVSKGLHTLDVGILISPVLIEYMKAMAEAQDISYTVGIEDDAQVEEQDIETAQVVAKSVFSSTDAPAEEVIEESLEEPAEEPKRGLMARRPMPEEEMDMMAEGQTDGI